MGKPLGAECEITGGIRRLLTWFGVAKLWILEAWTLRRAVRWSQDRQKANRPGSDSRRNCRSVLLGLERPLSSFATGYGSESWPDSPHSPSLLMPGANGSTGTALLFPAPSLQGGAFQRIPPSAEIRNGQVFGAKYPTKGIMIGERSRNPQTPYV